MSERLEDAISVIRNMVKIFHEQQGIGFQLSEHAEYVIQQAELVEDILKRNKELEHASKYNGELNEFLQQRNLPPNTLGRHVVDVVIDYVEDLEKSNKTIKSQTGHNFEVNRKLDAENQRYKQALEDLRVMSQDSVMMKKYWLIIDKALKGESK